MKYKISLLFLILILSGCGPKNEVITLEPRVISRVEAQSHVDEIVEARVTIDNSTTSDNVEEEVHREIEVPKTFTIDVNFASQAPHADWSLPYKEACEEASLIMGIFHLKNESLDSDVMKDEILKLVDWQNIKFGYFEDTNIDEMYVMATEYFGFEAYIIENPTINQLKYEILQGNMVVVPMAGQLLGNPHFRAPGPPYHAVIMTGYNTKGFIVNDPGTRFGKDYTYSYNVFMSAIHDYNAQNILDGTPRVLVIHN
jgi:hypothetical protein